MPEPTPVTTPKAEHVLRYFTLTAKPGEQCEHCGRRFVVGRHVEAVRIDAETLVVFCNVECILACKDQKWLAEGWPGGKDLK